LGVMLTLQCGVESYNVCGCIGTPSRVGGKGRKYVQAGSYFMWKTRNWRDKKGWREIDTPPGTSPGGARTGAYHGVRKPNPARARPACRHLFCSGRLSADDTLPQGEGDIPRARSRERNARAG